MGDDVKAEREAVKQPEKVSIVADAPASAGDGDSASSSLSALVVAAEKAVTGGSDDDKEALAALERLREFKVRGTGRRWRKKES